MTDDTFQPTPTPLAGDGTATTDPATAARHDVSVDGQSPDDPANSGAAQNTPPEAPETEGFLDTVGDAVESAYAEVKAAVFGAPAADGTVTVDFGQAGKLTGCVVLNAVTGTTAFTAGEVISVVVPGDGDLPDTIIAVDGKHIQA
ncbi:MAG: hypothetical protein NVSMB30_05350 [Hymenobacter sp.]